MPYVCAYEYSELQTCMSELKDLKSWIEEKPVVKYNFEIKTIQDRIKILKECHLKSETKTTKLRQELDEEEIKLSSKLSEEIYN